MMVDFSKKTTDELVKEIQVLLNKNIKFLKRVNGLTLHELSGVSGISVQTASKLCTRRYTHLPLSILVSLCKVFNVSLPDLLTKDLIEHDAPSTFIIPRSNIYER